MAKKTKPKHDGKMEAALKKHIKLVLSLNLVIIVLLVSYIVLPLFMTDIHQMQLDNTKLLNTASKDLDMLVEDLDKENLGVPLTRDHFCSYSNEKLGPGILYCTQEMLINIKLSEVEQRLVSQSLNTAWSKEKPGHKFIGVRGNNLVIDIDKDFSDAYDIISPGNIGCSMHYRFTPYTSERIDERGETEVDISCSERMDYPIYPIKEDAY